MTRAQLIDHVRRSDPCLEGLTDDQLDKVIGLLYPVAVMIARRRMAQDGNERDEDRNLRKGVLG